MIALLNHLGSIQVCISRAEFVHGEYSGVFRIFLFGPVFQVVRVLRVQDSRMLGYRGGAWRERVEMGEGVFELVRGRRRKGIVRVVGGGRPTDNF